MSEQTTPVQEKEINFGSINKSDVTRVIITLKNFKGHAFVDFREWYPENNIWHPTHKGFTLGAEVEILKEFRNIIDKSIEYLEKT